jgi:cupin 2 domain-containing protein
MYISSGNLLSNPPVSRHIPESFEPILVNDSVMVERIVTNGSFITPGPWYDQEKDEWVVLLKGNAELEFENDKALMLKTGDYVFIPAYKRHRVAAVSKNPRCVWLAIHGDFK